jgi:hypothetical protein
MDPEGRQRSLRSGPALEKLMGKSGQGRSRQLLYNGADLARYLQRVQENARIAIACGARVRKPARREIETARQARDRRT